MGHLPTFGALFEGHGRVQPQVGQLSKLPGSTRSQSVKKAFIHNYATSPLDGSTLILTFKPNTCSMYLTKLSVLHLRRLLTKSET